MKIFEKNKELIVELDGRIEFSNAGEVEAEIREALKEHPGLLLCLDADKLTYISSAGLRILMKLRKDLQDRFSIRNVCNEVYEIFDTTGMNLIIPIRKKMRTVSVDGCEVIGSGASGTVYRLDDETVVKVYHGGEEMLPVIEGEQKKARQAFISGIPTAISFGGVHVGDRLGAVYEMLNVHNLNDTVMSDLSSLEWVIPKFAAFLRSLHSREAYPGQLQNARDNYFDAVERFAPLLPEDIFVRIRELLGKMPENWHVVHGDGQLKNIILSGGELMLIDMDHLCTGDPVFEFAALFATYIAFNEVDPMSSVKFLGLDKDTSARIFHGTLREYLHRPGDECLAQTEIKVRIVGYLRFLIILVIEKKGEKSEFNERGISHAVKRLTELVFQVEELTF